MMDELKNNVIDTINKYYSHRNVKENGMEFNLIVGEDGYYLGIMNGTYSKNAKVMSLVKSFRSNMPLNEEELELLIDELLNDYDLDVRDLLIDNISLAFNLKEDREGPIYLGLNIIPSANYNLKRYLLFLINKYSKELNNTVYVYYLIKNYNEKLYHDIIENMNKEELIELAKSINANTLKEAFQSVNYRDLGYKKEEDLKRILSLQ